MATIEEQKAEVADALAKLHEQVEAIATSEEWQEWLKFLAKLHDYSPLNRLWMWAQWEARREAQAVWNLATCGAIAPLPGFSRPAAFSFWKDHGRMVRKGEKALTVLAPIIVKDRETDRDKLIGFRLKARTFDVSQTDGDALPENPAKCETLAGEGNPAVLAALVAVAKLNGWNVQSTMAEGYGEAVGGLCDFTSKTLYYRAERSPLEQLATFVHELAHSLLHSPEEYGRAHREARNVAEVEAESVAYVVADRLGLDTAPFSIGYVAGWAKGNGAMVARTAERVIDTAERILTAIETGALPAAKGAARPPKADAVAA